LGKSVIVLDLVNNERQESLRVKDLTGGLLCTTTDTLDQEILVDQFAEQFEVLLAWVLRYDRELVAQEPQQIEQRSFSHFGGGRQSQ
jgi:hypothetical protein